MAELDRMEAYRQAGVDLGLSNAASQIAADWCQTTWANRAGEFGEPISFDTRFSASKYLNFDEIRNRPDVYGTSGIDGTGTKPDFYEGNGNFFGLGKDLVAMAADDNPVEGGQTVFINNALIVSTLGEPGDDYLHYIDQLFQGLAEGANDAKAVLFTGEIAVHGARLQGRRDFSVDWIGDAVGLVHQDRMITGERVQENDELWGFAEPISARCNGISRIRKTFEKVYGNRWETEKFKDTTLGELAVTPSTIYSGLMTTLTGGYKIEVKEKVDIHGVAHVSGGSIWEKLGRMLEATQLGAHIYDPFEVPDILQHAQEITEVENPDGTLRPMSDEESYTTWHGGQGYILAIDGSDGERLKDEAAKQGISAKRIGKVTRGPGISIVSKAVRTPGKVLKAA